MKKKTVALLSIIRRKVELFYKVYTIKLVKKKQYLCFE
jgi:hypothetical protein